VAFQAIQERSEVAPDQIGAVDWPEKVPTPTGGFDKPEAALGKFATVPIYPGEPIIDKMLIDKAALKETHSNASLLLEKGTVAVAMPVTINSNVAEAIQAGDRVDIIATFTSQPAPTGSQTSLPVIATQHTLQDVLILQVGPWPGPSSKAQSSSAVTVVTMQLKEQDALVLKYAEQNANHITLVLRPANDHDLVTTEPVTLDYINQRFGYKFPSSGQ
jgi:Flp pilus assembly protein CpaB